VRSWAELAAPSGIKWKPFIWPTYSPST
jgi:hypothetical protein